MPAPIVAAAVKVAGSWAQKQVAKGNGPIIVGVIATGVAFSLMVWVSTVTSLLGGVLVAGGSDPCGDGGGTVGVGAPANAEALADIPAVSLEAYQKAATATGVPWHYIAAIGKVETNHGRYGGSQPDQKGDVRPRIRNSIGASGPMQFMPATWSSFQQDGNFDGTKSVDNIFDAALAAGHYLKRSGAPADMRKAIFAYNHANWYVDKVLAQAEKYVEGASGDVTAISDGSDVAVGASAWIRPVEAGPVTARFGMSGGRWSSGRHTGVDFGVPTGTPVFASQAGAVSVSHPGWAGNLVTIDHGVLDGAKVQTRYAHLSKVVVKSGVVAAGDVIAYSGALGNVTGPHLHFEVLVSGQFVNPETFLSGAGTPIYTGGALMAGCSAASAFGDETQNQQWGGYSNGMVPLEEMCELKAARTQYLRCDAAGSYDLLAAAYQKKFGKKLPLTQAYMSFTEQAVCDGLTCGTAGTSPFGWGLAIEFGAPVSSKKSAEYRWMKTHGINAGWVETSSGWIFGKKSTPAATV